ncbi:uncharacterized protein LOC109725483 isoform X2 [Ananas comosus]|uniref:Uncharacterized protein LOC109725483 isoform X2 n=1 Tax=Ananas comosus TaxID=4615 RepID=A0A6P5GX91_ANACO|nr:uncharacterized protein LOC109725483 isoform X2 [Ananas comosus]
MLSGSFDVGKLAVSVEAKNSFCYAKAQLLLILIETLDLENLLQLVHDEVPFRQGFSAFSLLDVQEMDAEVSSLSDLGFRESGPLILAWAVFLCLLSSLPESNTDLFTIDHTSYARQAFEAAAFIYLLEILQSNTLRESDGPVSGFLSVLRTLISSFIASYEISQQAEDDSLNMILDILCKIYDGEESLSVQFWDKESFVDSPIRSVLYMLEKEYPLRLIEFIRFLSAVCGGAWSAQCVYNYLENMSGITTLYEIPGRAGVANNYDLIEIHYQIGVPGIEGYVLPTGTCGYILKLIDDNVALVRWKCPHSGVFLLLLILAHGLHSFNYEEVYYIVNLLYRMISGNKALCFSLLHADKSLRVRASKESGQIEEDVRIDVVNVFCTSIFKLIQDVSNASIVATSFNILSEMIKCAPSRVFEVALKSNVFEMEMNGQSSSSWFLSRGLARMLYAACEENRDCCMLTTSVLDFIIQVVEKGAEDNVVSALVVFSLQYVLVNHMHWKFEKTAGWKATLKVLELVKSCIRTTPITSKLGGLVRDIILYDSSIQNVLWRILFTSMQILEKLYATCHHQLELEDVQLVACCVLDVFYDMLADLSEETYLHQPAFVNMLLSSTAKPMPFVTAVVMLISSYNLAIQVAAVRVFSMLCFISSRTETESVENANFLADSMQNNRLCVAICCILDEKESQDNCLIIEVFKLLNSVACYQPALLVSVMVEENEETLLKDNGDMKSHLTRASLIKPVKLRDANLIGLILKYIQRSTDLLDSDPHLLLSVLDFFKTLWEGGIQYIAILERLGSSELFWENLSACISTYSDKSKFSVVELNDESERLPLRYRCHCRVLEIMAHEIFLQERLLQGEKSKTLTANTSKEQVQPSNKLYLRVLLKKWCDGPIMESLIKSYSSSGYENELVRQAKVAVCVLIVHLIIKLSTGDSGSLSLALVRMIHTIYQKLSEHPAFAVLLARYSLRGYSSGEDVTNLVINDLYYHIQGELEGRETTPGPFQELFSFLLDLGAFQFREQKEDQNILDDFCMFDISRIRRELGFELWDYSDWKASKEVAEKMFHHMHKANLMISLANSKLFGLKALIKALSVYNGNIGRRNLTLLDKGISEPLVISSIKLFCNSLQDTVDSVIPTLNADVILLDFLSAQEEMLLTLSTILLWHHQQSKTWRNVYPVFLLFLKVSSSGIKFLADITTFTPTLTKSLKLLLLLLLTSLQFSYTQKNETDESDRELNLFADVSLVSVGLLPVLCKFAEKSEYTDLSVASIDMILKGFLIPNIWLPVLQKHLRLQLLLQKVQSNGTESTSSVILNFLLTLACTKGGAKMLHSASIFSSLRLLLQSTSDEPFLCNGTVSPIGIEGKHVHLWQFSIAIITSVIYSLGDDVSCADVVDNAIHFLSEKFSIISFLLSAPTFPINDQNTKRARKEKQATSLASLNLIEQVLMLICVLVRYQASWRKGMEQVDSELREAAIHLVAFISKGAQKIGDLLNSPPIGKEEFELDDHPPLIKSKSGWFASVVNATIPKPSPTPLSLVIKDQKANQESTSLVNQTLFTEMVAVQIYRIAFLALEFLCIQAKAAVNRVEEVGFVDLAHFPELPMPEVLHGLQDQAITIVTEVCEANKSKSLQKEVESMCLLLLQTLEKSLYLELCVSHSCGIRPVLGRVEDFSKQIKAMFHVVEQHKNLKASLRSLKQITTLLCPGLFQASNLI